MPCGPRMNGKISTSVVDSSLGPLVGSKIGRNISRMTMTLTNTNYGAIPGVEFVKIQMQLAPRGHVN